ncbi:PAP2-domain-containing protein [Cylindrobasidium torrendii FP15055 ss-10]|uniref:PAP2-domain-containing protein n=1 Tax=Cylindrobasidium torrendii FP15055 ss-10 TaxID=1314674 RepID=A0A0D7AYU1_9AGAR|nr:PAP2-domain-containing protein [Cylindrobasidium torrendii FP15055 ss-10]
MGYTAVSNGVLDLTHVVYDDSSRMSLFLALITLSPILLMASYAALVVQTREYLFIVMWAGQFAGEGLNWVIKRMVKQSRPIESLGTGYGFPSSHSQYMGYFASFLICHLYLRHEFVPTGIRLLDLTWRATVYLGLLAWTGLVAYSRYDLGYHNMQQILWGLGIGIVLGVALYIVSQHLPRRYPGSLFGRTKRLVIASPVATFLQIRDGWDLWKDGGRGDEWSRWRKEWAARQHSKEQ